MTHSNFKQNALATINAGLFSISLFTGPNTHLHAETIFNSLSHRDKNFTLWDIPHTQKAAAFHHALENASIAGIAYNNSHFLACAWICPIGPNSQTSAIHFTFAKAGRPLAHKIGSAFLHLQPADNLICLIPKPFFTAQIFAKSLGFHIAALLPNACWLAHLNKTQHGLFMIWNREKYCSCGEGRPVILQGGAFFCEKAAPRHPPQKSLTRPRFQRGRYT